MKRRGTGLVIWSSALLVYLAFAGWYGGVRGPLRPDEVDAYMARLAQQGEPRDAGLLAAVRAFLEADDGREFFMVNLVRMHPGEVAVPGSDAREPSPRVLERYTRPFMGALLRRAGHPAFVAPAAATYLERWDVPPDPGWSFAGVIRYRSRRDMIELVVDPAFEPWHAHKLAAIANTLAFPVTPARIWIGPRVIVGLLLALAAALVHLTLALRAQRG
jgi:hypothetical protein